MAQVDGFLLPYSRINPMTHIRLERKLPRPGKILVQEGQQVETQQRVAQTTPQADIRVINVARLLGLKDSDLTQVMVKKRGDRVEAGEIIAARRGILPFLHKPCRSPITGKLATVAHGWVVIEAEADPLNLMALISGRVVAVDGNYGVTIETWGAHVAGACGMGGEAQGMLQVLVDNPADELAADDIGMACNRAVIVGGAGLSPEVLDRAREMKVAGMVVGSIGAWLHQVDPLPFPIVATEGYGRLPMSLDAFRVLKEVEGHQASIVGGMCDAWNPMHPAVIVSLEDVPQDADQIPESESYPYESQSYGGMAGIGDRVRAARPPLAGRVGRLATLHQETRRLASGIPLSGIQVDFDGQKQFVPWLNLEQVG